MKKKLILGSISLPLCVLLHLKNKVIIQMSWSNIFKAIPVILATFIVHIVYIFNYIVHIKP